MYHCNKTTPSRWKIQYLKDNVWIDAYSFRENDTRSSGDPIIDTDGYVELEYGLKIPEEYQLSFIFAETLSSDTLLPELSLEGYAYLIIENEGESLWIAQWLQVIVQRPFNVALKKEKSRGLKSARSTTLSSKSKMDKSQKILLQALKS